MQDILYGYFRSHHRPPPPTIQPPRQPPETPGRLLKARQRNPGKAISHTEQL